LHNQWLTKYFLAPLYMPEVESDTNEGETPAVEPLRIHQNEDVSE